MKDYKYSFDEMMIPFWTSKIMYNESVMMLSQEGRTSEAPLLFKAEKILSVKASNLYTEYIEGEDWVYEGGLLKLTRESKAAYMTTEELYPMKANEGWTFPKVGGGHILFQEKSFFHDKQLAVTYLHSGKEWMGSKPIKAGNTLSRTSDMLKERLPMKVVLYGDSISVGYNASGFTGVPPFQPSWGNLFAEKLRRTFSTDVTLLNPSKGGEDSAWGLKNVDELVSVHYPDLVILAFGMNDGTGRVSPKVFKENIQAMIEKIHKYNPNTEFILVTSMLPNKVAAIPGQPELSFWGEQENYKMVLEELTGTSIAVADVTTIHRELLKHKRYCDMTGNNVNHPNDFLIRWYAQVISALYIVIIDN